MSTRSLVGRQAIDGQTSLPLASKIIVVVIVASAFGPYVHSTLNLGLRTEQFVVYPLAVLILCLRGTKVRLAAVFPALAPWSIFVAIALVGAFGTQPPSEFASGSALASADNLLLPVAVMLLVAGIGSNRNPEALLNLVSRVIVICVALNALLAFASMRSTEVFNLLRQFWAQPDSGQTISELAADQGRFSGIFNHPAEAGIAYSLAALLAVYLLARRPWILAGTVALISLGGILCVSKIFLLCGLPLALILLVRRAVIARRAGALLATMFAIVLGPKIFGLGDWSGLDFLLRLIRPSAGQSLVELYTAGRFSSGSGLRNVVEQVLEVSPIFGVGVAGWKVPYDSTWGEAMVVAGVLGTLAVIGTYVSILAMAMTMQRGPTRDLAVLVTILLVGASFGISSLTANRVSTIVWVVISLLFLIRRASLDSSNGPPLHASEIEDRPTSYGGWPSTR